MRATIQLEDFATRIIAEDDARLQQVRKLTGKSGWLTFEHVLNTADL